MPITWKKFSEEQPPFSNKPYLFNVDGFLTQIVHKTLSRVLMQKLGKQNPDLKWMEIPNQPLYTLDEVKEIAREAIYWACESCNLDDDLNRCEPKEYEIDEYLNKIK